MLLSLLVVHVHLDERPEDLVTLPELEARQLPVQLAPLYHFSLYVTRDQITKTHKWVDLPRMVAWFFSARS